MIATVEDEIYNKLKTNVGFDRSEDHLNFIRQFGIPHHIFGSYTGIKTSDYATIPVTPKQHEEAEKDKSGFAIKNLYRLIEILILRIKYLEEELK